MHSLYFSKFFSLMCALVAGEYQDCLMVPSKCSGAMKTVGSRSMADGTILIAQVCWQ